MSKVILDFIRDSYRAGKKRDEINAALLDAGWREDELNTCWARFSDKDFPVPVPRPVAYASPRLTALNLFYFIVLYIMLYSGVAILFTFLDYHLPDGLGQKGGAFYSSRAIGDSIRGYLAAIIVAAPLVWFTKSLLQKASNKVGGSIPAMRLRLLNLTLLFAAIIMFCNITSFVYFFLSGELGIRFIIKVLILSAMSFGLYFYFKPEMVKDESKA